MIRKKYYRSEINKTFSEIALLAAMEEIQERLTLEPAGMAKAIPVVVNHPERSAGDGMENEKSVSQETNLFGVEADRTKIEMKAPSSSASLTTTPRIKSPSLYGEFEFPQTTKRKEAKFVPYEPYKAAIKPILPLHEKGGRKSKGGATKVKDGDGDGGGGLTETHIPFPLLFNCHSNATPLIRVLRDVVVPENEISLRNRLISSSSSSSSSMNIIPGEKYHQMEKEQWEKEKSKLEEECKILKIEKREIESQFKIQTQVNCELKKLLVASMGEDMQSRVQFLSEDKARLASDIEQYSKMILEEDEELERLAIQSDIWRSKFLACSLMVDELAGWKALLSRKYEEAKESIQWLINERKEIKLYQMKTFRSLKELSQVFEPQIASTTTRGGGGGGTKNILTLSKKNHFLSEELSHRLIGVKSRPQSPSISDVIINCGASTPAEEFAFRVLATKEIVAEKNCQLSESENRPQSSIVRHRNKMCHFHFGNLTMHGCRHCSGDIDVV